jgi:hypothetical protein
MAQDHIRYDILAQAALRGVVRTVMTDAAKKGLPGEHHFKITFSTGAPGVRLSDRMRAKYPETMTIILQHQFWDLTVREDGFDVGLSFGGVPEMLTVPFDAVIAFFDPSVQFGLQFEMFEPDASAQAGATAKLPEQPAAPASRPDKRAKKSDALPPPAAQPIPSGGGEVVSLDRFRKK